MTGPEDQARQSIDRLLAAAGWAVQDVKSADLHAARGVALREFPLVASPRSRGEGQGEGPQFADYLLYVDGKAAGVIEAKKAGATLTGVEIQSTRYAQGLPASLPAHRRPLPFLYESTGAETHFTNALDPEPRARNVFAFHRPETLADWLRQLPSPASAGEGPGVGLLRELPIALPPRSEQDRIAAEVDCQLSTVSALERNVSSEAVSQQLHRAILHEAFGLSRSRGFPRSAECS